MNGKARSGQRSPFFALKDRNVHELGTGRSKDWDDPGADCEQRDNRTVKVQAGKSVCEKRKKKKKGKKGKGEELEKSCV